MTRALCIALGGMLWCAHGLWSAAAAEPSAKAKAAPADKPAADKPAEPPPQITWLTDYAEAVNQAKADHKMVLIYFFPPGDDAAGAQFEKQVLADPDVAKKLQQYVPLRLPQDAKVKIKDEEIELLKHQSFRHMLGRPGIAVLDYSHEKGKTYGLVVSAFPFESGKGLSKKQMEVILGLPPGTITQRTLIYAVRMHPENPASTNGRFSPDLARETESHAFYQARIRLQGHHHWGMRFQRINRILPRGLLAAEVCAESWPGETMVEAAVDCVACWRYSSGHWRSVRAFQPWYAYDMKLGSNGIWYACGIFGKGRILQPPNPAPASP